MTSPTLVHFDFIDPASYLLLLQLQELRVNWHTLDWVGLELAVPPAEMIDPTGEGWRDYCNDVDARAAEMGRSIPRPDFVPWTRKAHELALHGRAQGAHLINALFRAHFEESRDLGRVDVLTEIAVAARLDRTETRAVLDVDKYAEEVATARARALESGIERVPTVIRGSRSLVGPASINDLRILFDSPGEDAPGT